MDSALAGARGDVEVGADEPMTLYSASPETVREISHRPEMADELADGTVLLGQERAERFGLHDGQVLSLEGADGQSHDLRVHVDANLQMSLVTPALEEPSGGHHPDRARRLRRPRHRRARGRGRTS